MNASLKERSVWFGMVLAGVTGLVHSGSDALAQEQVTPPSQTTQDQGNVQVQTQASSDSAVLNAIDEKVSGGNVRVSELIGMDIQNPAGDDIAEINDLVIDARTGQLKYAAVTYGGFLGLGNKLFAVPFEAFKFQPEPGEADDVVLVLNFTENQLDASQGFDKDHWPNWSDPAFARDLNQRYGVQQSQSTTTRDSQGVDVNVDGRSGVDVKVD